MDVDRRRRTLVPPTESPPHISTAQLPAGRTGEPAEYVQYEARSAGAPSGNLDPPIYAPDFRWGALSHPSDHRVPDVCRWINHSDVLELLSSVLLAQGELSRNKANTAKHIEPMLPRPLDPRLVMVSRTFRHLQEQRHAADYDDRYDITKRSALERVTLADRALSALWNLHEQRDPGLVLLLKLGIGGVKVAKTR
jgi:hypothetical protein